MGPAGVSPGLGITAGEESCFWVNTPARGRVCRAVRGTQAGAGICDSEIKWQHWPGVLVQSSPRGRSCQPLGMPDFSSLPSCLQGKGKEPISFPTPLLLRTFLPVGRASLTDLGRFWAFSSISIFCKTWRHKAGKQPLPNIWFLESGRAGDHQHGEGNPTERDLGTF